MSQVLISSFDYPSFYKFYGEPTNKSPYQVGEIRLWLPELQAEEQEVRKVKVKKLKVGSKSPYQVGGMRLWL